jgi:hypothetical protein
MIEPIQTEAEVLARLRGPRVYPVEYSHSGKKSAFRVQRTTFARLEDFGI